MIGENRLSRSEAAAMVGVGERQINQLMSTWGVHRPTAQYVVKATIAQIKWEIRKRYAIEFIGGYSTLEEAAESAGVSTRQMRRWIKDLLETHYHMPFSDLKHVSTTRRAVIAVEIEEAEGLEYAKQAALQAIRRGEATIEEEATSRLVAAVPQERKNV